MTVKPITPAEAHQKFCEEQIPDFVIEIFNSLLAEKHSQPNRMVKVPQDEVIHRILKHEDCQKGIKRQQIFDAGWLNIETIYEKAGWDVSYISPDIGDSYAPYFEFVPKN